MGFGHNRLVSRQRVAGPPGHAPVMGVPGPGRGQVPSSPVLRTPSVLRLKSAV
jgi:hypothetical protein